MHRSYLAIIFVLTLASSLSFTAAADGVDAADIPRDAYQLEIDKSDRLLRVKFNGEVYREFSIATGSGGSGGKQRMGDKRTPEGIYRVMGFNDSSKFHLFMRLNYPNVNDAFYGLKNKLISGTEFEKIIESLRQGKLPLQNTALGGAIGIHGVGVENAKKLRIHANLDWTDGCIALTNDEVSELRQYVSLGTEVVIRE